MTKYTIGYYYTNSGLEYLYELSEWLDVGDVHGLTVSEWDNEIHGIVPNIEVLTDDESSSTSSNGLQEFAHFIYEKVGMYLEDGLIMAFDNNDNEESNIPLQPIIQTIQEKIDKFNAPFELIYLKNMNDKEVENYVKHLS